MTSRAHPLVRCPLLGCVLIAGCGGDSTDPDANDEDGHPPAAMVGLWVFQSATENGTPVPLSAALEWNQATVEARFNIQANGGYQYEKVDASGAQIWSEFGWVFVDQERRHDGGQRAGRLGRDEE